MRITLLTLLLFCSALLSSPSYAAYWTEYSLSLKKAPDQNPGSEQTLYDLEVKDTNGSVISPTGGLFVSSYDIAKNFGMRLHSGGATLNVVVYPSGQLALSVSNEQPLDEADAYFSCFKYWWNDLLTTREQERIESLLHTDDTEAKEELRAFGAGLRTVIKNDFATCSVAYYKVGNIEGDTATFLHTGVVKWVNRNFLENDYRNFATLLDQTRAAFEAALEVPANVRNEILRDWIEVVSQRAVADQVFDAFDDVMSSGTVPPQLAYLGLQQWANAAEVQTFYDSSQASDALTRTFRVVDTLLLACFDYSAANATSRCVSEQQAQERVARLIFTPANASWNIAPFSFVARNK